MNGWLLADKNNVSKTSKELPNLQKEPKIKEDFTSSSETCYQYEEGEQCYTWYEELGNFGPCEIDSCSGSGNDDGGSSDWPDDPDWGDDDNNDGGGGSEDCDETAFDGGCTDWTEEPETCQTGNSVIDDTAVQGAMEQVWLDSYSPSYNPFDDNDRRERMFMVTAESSGYQVEEFEPGPNTSPCHFDGGRISIPSNIVALFHTHPFGDGDSVDATGCPPRYDGDFVSQADRNLVEEIANNIALPAIPMYVMDKDKIRVLDSSDTSQYSQIINRCGF